jgi:hypothetical protein
MQQPLSERREAAEDKLPPAQIRKRGAHLHNYITYKAAGGERETESSLTRVQNDNCSPPQRQQQPANLFRVSACRQCRRRTSLCVSLRLDARTHVELRINQTLFIKFSLRRPCARKHTQNHIYSSSGLLRPLDWLAGVAPRRQIHRSH